jgi:hypothetical protein
MPKPPYPTPLEDLLVRIRESSLPVRDRARDEEWARILDAWLERWYMRGDGREERAWNR